MHQGAHGEATSVDPFVVPIRAAALRHVVSNLIPLRFLLLPLAIVVGLLMQEYTDPLKLAIWQLTAVFATVLVAATAARFRVVREPALTEALLAAASLASVGALAGLCPWVAQSGDPEVFTIMVLIPAVSCSVGCIVCAGRFDLFAAHQIPIVVLTVSTLWAAGDPVFRSFAGLFLAFAVSQVFLYARVSSSLLALLRSRLDTDTIAERLASDQHALSDAYAQLSHSNEQLHMLASHDPLTGLLNRRGTIEFIDNALAGRGADDHVGLLFCDVDRFKAINDVLGHRGGDSVLTVIADRMRRTLREGSIAGRIGGDEFVIVLPNHDHGASADVAKQLLRTMAQHVHAEGRTVPSSMSIGLAVAPDHGLLSSDLMRNANTALHRAKKAGRDQFVAFDPYMQVELQLMLDAEQSLRDALERNEIMPFFQPEVDAASGAVIGAELLARWLRPDGRMVPATDFLSLARRAGLLERLTEHVLMQARPEIRRLTAQGLPADFRFRINLGPASTDPSWRNNPLGYLLGDLDPTRVTVDVREGTVLDELGIATTALQEFHDVGGRVCLDDFVHGVSSLSLLRRLPIDEVRVNRDAIDAISSHPHDRAIVRSIISVAQEIGLMVSAQGVETGAQADILLALGCVRQQGHLYAPALPPDVFERFMTDRQVVGAPWQRQDSDSWVERQHG